LPILFIIQVTREQEKKPGGRDIPYPFRFFQVPPDNIRQQMLHIGFKSLVFYTPKVPRWDPGLPAQ
jgi:hypothetical protein